MLVAAVATGIAGPIAFAGSFFSYMSFDLLWWVAGAWAAVCLLRSQQPRWWIVIGAAIGLGMLTRYTILALPAGLLIGMLLTPNRRYFRSGWFWCGVALALAMASPVILWQFHHDFAALAWTKSIHARDVGWGKTDHFLLNPFWNVTSPTSDPLWCAGLWFLFATRTGKPFRMIGWMYVVPLVLFLMVKGRDYYMVPAYPMLLAAGAVWGESWLQTKSADAQGEGVTRGAWISLAVTALDACLPSRSPSLPCSLRGGVLPTRRTAATSTWRSAGRSLSPTLRMCATRCPPRNEPACGCCRRRGRSWGCEHVRAAVRLGRGDQRNELKLALWLRRTSAANRDYRRVQEEHTRQDVASCNAAGGSRCLWCRQFRNWQAQ